MSIDRHTLATISIVGSALDVLGALYLAYDLLGGEHGPLRTLTRAVTYGLLFGLGYGAVLGLVFGVISGLTHGFTLGWEYSRASKGNLRPGFWFDAAMSTTRAAGFGVGTAYLFGGRFGLTFGLLGAIGQTIAYTAGIRPSMDYQPSKRPRLTWHQAIGVANRTVGYAVAGYVSALVGHLPGALHVGIETGLMVGAITAIASICTPFIEWGADHLPERRMGVFGVGLLLVGFAMCSFQYWVALFDITVR